MVPPKCGGVTLVSAGSSGIWVQQNISLLGGPRMIRGSDSSLFRFFLLPFHCEVRAGIILVYLLLGPMKKIESEIPFHQ